MKIKNKVRYSSPRQVRAAALVYLNRRHYARNELKNKLMQKGAKEADIDDALNWLIEDGILDEEKMVEAYIHQRKDILQKGPAYIYRELIQKGIDSAIIKDGLSLYYDEKEEKRILDILIIKEIRDLPLDSQKQQKFWERLIRLIKRRGFKLALAMPMIEEQKRIALDKRDD